MSTLTAKNVYNYCISWDNPNSHLLKITLTTQKSSGKTTSFSLPAWRPGRYFLQNFSSTVLEFKAYDKDGNSLPFTKITKDTWEVSNPDKGEITIEYSVMARWVDAGSTYLNENLLYVNPINCLMYAEKDYKRPAYLEIPLLPENWKIATSLKNVDKNKWYAESYHLLVDSPFFAAENIRTLSFTMPGNKKIFLHFRGEYELTPGDEKKLKENIRKIIEQQVKVFGELPLEEYHFLYLLVPFYIRHAVEHSYSAMFVLPKNVASQGSALRGAYSITSHEFFHLWNIKRIRPANLMPYDYSREQYTSLHWFTEGVTDYYADVFLVRAGLWKIKNFIDALEGSFNRLENQYAARFVSPERSSMDSWLEMAMYKTKLNRISYYPLGFRIGFALDIYLRSESGNKITLDDVMKYLYENYYQKGKGVPEGEIEKICRILLKKDVSDFFETYVRGTAPYPWKELFAKAGIVLKEFPDYTNIKSLGISEFKEVREGILIEDVYPTSEVLEAGAHVQDIITAINGKPVEFLNLARIRPGEKVKISFLRDGQKSHGEFIYTGKHLLKEYKFFVNEKNKILRGIFGRR